MEWKQEFVWVRRNDQGVLVEFSESTPPVVQRAIDKRWAKAIDAAKQEMIRRPGAKMIGKWIAEYESGSRAEHLLEALEALSEMART